MRRTTKFTAAAVILALAVIAARPGPVRADNPTPYPGTRVIKTGLSYAQLVAGLTRAVKNNRMGLVTRASATMGAKKLGIRIAGNMVVGVYHPRFAVRMLKASVAAGVEAPIRFYITENTDGRATLSYRKPSAVFAPYENADLDRMAGELDTIFAAIARDATGG